MSWLGIIFLCGAFLLLAPTTGADVMLNINQPIHDVSDKFVSFTMKPEDLFAALDSSNRKTITRMASMLSHSHIKFVGDYYFADKTAGIRLRNPTKIVWKGFNKWTKAVNWSMIIPVPYKPDNWDPMDTLKILNTSQMVNIDEAIWQLGTDFGFSRAADYASELKTFNVMVDSFKQTVSNWQTMGADISAGSSPEETRRYVEMSRDLNSAYGWIQSEDMFPSNDMDVTFEQVDPALRVLFTSNVPVWLSFSTWKSMMMDMNDEITDGFRWAQSMGDAANMGFDTIFKPLTLEDMQRPNFNFYVTVLFKRIMGSRVYPARPMAVFGSNNKLYTHCANMVSGGLAFMVVNKQELPLHISVRTMNRLQDMEVWQYALTMHNGQVMLNNNKITINSTLIPEVRRKNTLSALQLNTPGSSVSFWVLPNANLEHCHFTEVQTPIVSEDNSSQKIKRYSSSDRLLKELIKETTKPVNTPAFPLAGLISRHRRSASNEDRSKRFVLEGAKEEVQPLDNIAGSLVQELKTPFKRNIYSPQRRIAALEWLSNIFKDPLNFDLPLLKRNARQSNAQTGGSFFMTRDGRKTTITKKITEIKKPEKKTKEIPVEDQEFDEEKFFKNVGVQPEPDYVPIPEGDVFLSNIASVNGDEPEEELTIETKNNNNGRLQKKEIVSEMKPLRLLPTEFFETFPTKPVQLMPSHTNYDPSLNSFLYSDLFGKTYVKNLPVKEVPTSKGFAAEMHEQMPHLDQDGAMKAQFDINQKVGRTAVENDRKSTGNNLEHFLANDEQNGFDNSQNLSNVFGDAARKPAQNTAANENKSRENGRGKFDELPWWDLSAKRLKRSLDSRYSADSWRTNMISKEDDAMPAAEDMSPVRLHHFEHNVEEVVRSTDNNNNNSKNNGDYDEIGVGPRVVKSFKDQFTKLVDLFSHHANEWYNALSKQLGVVLKETNTTTTKGNRVI